MVLTSDVRCQMCFQVERRRYIDAAVLDDDDAVGSPDGNGDGAHKNSTR